MSCVFLLLVFDKNLCRIVELHQIIVIRSVLWHLNLLVLQESYSFLQMGNVIIETSNYVVLLLQSNLHCS